MFTSIQVSMLLSLVTAVDYYWAFGRALKKQNITQRTSLIVLSALFSLTVEVVTLFGIYKSTNSEFLCMSFGSGLVDTIIFVVSGFIDVLMLVIVIVLYEFTIAVVN